MIYALTAHLKKTHTDAVALATFVDRKVDTVQFLCVISGECVCFILSLWYLYPPQGSSGVQSGDQGSVSTEQGTHQCERDMKYYTTL